MPKTLTRNTLDDSTCVSVSQNMCESVVYFDALDFIPIVRLRRLVSLTIKEA